LADRIKIARNAKGDDINLSVQFILNCGGDMAGSCWGGSHTGVYEFIKNGVGFVPLETCMPYLACSSDSNVGFCPHIDTTCSAINTCRTCNTFVENNGFCAPIDVFPNATVAEYGIIELDPDAIMAEIYARGPVASEVAGEPLHNYTGGVFADEAATKETTHVVSIVGWGSYVDGKYWIIRNSWVRTSSW
jgi:cathepsin X